MIMIFACIVRIYVYLKYSVKNENKNKFNNKKWKKRKMKKIKNLFKDMQSIGTSCNQLEHLAIYFCNCSLLLEHKLYA